MQKITSISATNMHRHRGDLIKRCFRDKEHFIIEKDGVPLVVVIPIDEYDIMQRSIKQNLGDTHEASADNLP